MFLSIRQVCWVFLCCKVLHQHPKFVHHGAAVAVGSDDTVTWVGVAVGSGGSVGAVVGSGVMAVGRGVLVGVTGVLVGGTGVGVGGTGVLVGGTGVGVGGTGVLVGGTGVCVGGTAVGGFLVFVAVGAGG